MKAKKSETQPSADGAPTVFVVDDDQAMRESLEFLFRSVGMEVQAFDSAETFLNDISGDLHGCLLLDVRMPGMSGLDLQEMLIRRKLSIPVILLTAHADVPMAVRAMRNGAFDFIEKPCNDQLLIDRIHQALAKAEREHRDDAAIQEIRAAMDTLSPRERQVMDLVVEGLLNKQIAGELDISIKTVEVHRARVMEKMHAESLAELVRMVTTIGLGEGEVPEEA